MGLRVECPLKELTFQSTSDPQNYAVQHKSQWQLPCIIPLSHDISVISTSKMQLTIVIATQRTLLIVSPTFITA